MPRKFLARGGRGGALARWPRGSLGPRVPCRVARGSAALWAQGAQVTIPVPRVRLCGGPGSSPAGEVTSKWSESPAHVRGQPARLRSPAVPTRPRCHPCSPSGGAHPGTSDLPLRVPVPPQAGNQSCREITLLQPLRVCTVPGAGLAEPPPPGASSETCLPPRRGPGGGPVTPGRVFIAVPREGEVPREGGTGRRAGPLHELQAP